MAPAYAHAATYEVRLCSDASAAGFTAHNDSPTLMLTSARCPGNDDHPFCGVMAKVNPADDAPKPGALASWTITAPSGTKLQQVNTIRGYDKRDRNYEVLVVTAEGGALQACGLGTLCSEVAQAKPYGPINTQSLWFGVRCAPSRLFCTNSTDGSRAWIAVYSATVTVQDPDPPTVAAPATGTEWQRGTAIEVVANDASGIGSVALSAGTQTVARVAQACDFTRMLPCPPSVRVPLAPDLPDGTHTISAVATDAAGQSRSSAPATLKLDRTAPEAPIAMSVDRSPDGSYVYTWRNPAQTGAAPIAAVHSSDGETESVARGADIERLVAPSGDLRLWLEDEAGNADRAKAAGLGDGTAVGVNPPLLRPTTPSPRLRITRATRSGKTLVIRGTIARAATARISATVTRGKRSVRASAKPRKGTWTIRVRLTTPLRRKGTNAITVRYGGQAGYSPAKATKRLKVR